MTIKLWGRESSFNVQKTLWALEETGIDYQRIDAGGSFGGLREPDYLAMNPNGYIPTMQDGDFCLWESHAIIRYVAEKYGSAGLYPQTIEGRALANQWMDWMQSNLHVSFMEMFWNLVRAPKDVQNPAKIQKIRERLMAHMSILNDRLAQSDYLAGAAFSMADIPSACVLYRFYEMPMERPPLLHVESWYARLQTRPAFRKAVMIPFDELYGRLAF